MNAEEALRVPASDTRPFVPGLRRRKDIARVFLRPSDRLAMKRRRPGAKKLGRLLRASSVAKTYLRGGLEFPPLVRGLGLTWVPKPERSFVSFGRPISTARYRCRTDDVGAMREQRNRMASSIEAQLAQLQQVLSRLSGQGADAPKTAHDWGELVAEFERQVDRATRRMGGATEATPRRTQSRTNRT